MGIDVPQSNVSRLKQFYGGHFLCPSGLWHRQAAPSLVHLLCSLPSSSCHLNSLFVGMPLWGPQCDWAMLLHLNNQLLDGEICKECKETQNVWLSTGNTPNMNRISMVTVFSYRSPSENIVRLSVSNSHSGCIFPYQSNVVASRSTAHPAGTFLLYCQWCYADRCNCSEWRSPLFDGHLKAGCKEARWGGHTAPLSEQSKETFKASHVEYVDLKWIQYFIFTNSVGIFPLL